MSGKMWALFGAIVVLIIGGMVYLSMQGRVDVGDLDAKSSGKIIGAEERNGQIGDHVFGNKDAKIVLVEYGDFQCNPGCRLFHENFSPILEDENYMSQIAFVYRHFPLSQIHPNAVAASATAIAAGKQGKFWEMWDTLFKNQAAWSAASASERSTFFEGYAKELGLDIEKLRDDIKSDEVSQKIKFDRAVGQAAGVTGTPTLFLNGEQVDGERMGSTDELKKLLDEAIAEAK